MRIFSPEELSEGNIPHLESFAKLADRAREMLERNPAVGGAVILGSAANGTPTHASDFDIVISLRDPPRAYPAINSLAMTAKRSFIPLQPILILEEHARAGFHSIDCGFREHVNAAIKRHGFIKANPLEGVSFEWRDPRAEVRDYVTRKHHALLRDYAMWSALDFHARAKQLKRIMEAPVAVARKILFLRFGNAAADSKMQVRELFAQTFIRSHPSLVDGFLLRVRFEDRHAALIKGLAEPRIKRNELVENYCNFLREVENQAESVARFVASCAPLLSASL